MKLTRLVIFALAALALTNCSRSGQTADSGQSGAANGALTIKSGVLTVGMEIGYPPMEYYDTDGKTPIGFDVELSKALAAKLGLTFEYVDTAWDGIFAGVDTGKYDCIISSVTYTGERAALFNFTKPYVANSQLLVVRQDSKVKPKSLDQVVGLRLTYQAETTSDTL
ncbi:MAG: ABC transporter substrate-binding protein, partial [Treponema sp.]|nr:ABC transporter substrate-binding protein [Treponema sp.]